MNHLYIWGDIEQTTLKRECSETNTCAFIPADPANRDYAAFLASGAVASEYVEPEPPAPLTPAEKLEAAGLTVDELKELLGLPTA